MIGDTTPDAAAAQWRALIAMTGEQRLLQALELTDLVLRIQEEGRRARGDLSDTVTRNSTRPRSS